MRMDRQGWVYGPFRLRPDRRLAAQMLAGMGLAGAETQPAEPPPTYLIFLRGETAGADLFGDLQISRQRALHGGQKYEWLAPYGWDDELDVTAKVVSQSEKTGKSGRICFADVEFEYRRARDGVLAVRELTRLIERLPA